ncbi:MAG: pyruvate dehydrogenase (acetyl-transferring) E1 component subunit alpha [Alphaproteobacteria bacterium]
MAVAKRPKAAKSTSGRGKPASRSASSPKTNGGPVARPAPKPATKPARPARAAAAGHDPSPADALRFYRTMLLIRRFEEKAGQMYGMGLIGGFCHLYIGEEAVVTGVLANLKPTDSVITSYRDHGHMLACGMDPKGVMAELTGRRTGYSKGKGGSMHMFSTEKRFYGGHGIVAAQVPIGSGLAFAHRYQDDGGVAATFFGEGAANQGQVYEAFNMAALWKLPVLYVIENNMYGMGTSVERAAAVREMYKHGLAMDIPSEPVNGMDVFEVWRTTRKALDHIRAGQGPYLLEMKTYRYRGHSMSDPAKYRTRDEVQKVRAESDPIDRLGIWLRDNGHADESALKDIDRETKAIVSEAAEFAQESPEPDPSELYTDVMVEA